jgi:Na+/H+ antiporter NhaC
MKKGLLAVSPLLVFLVVYLISSIVAGDFYRVPVSSAFLVACMYAVLIAKGGIRKRLDTFSRGAGHPDVLLMIWIFILAGAFAGTARDIGSVDATVSAALHVIPPQMLFAGLFLTACFISMAVGTSVGTIVALAPIGAGIAGQCDVPQAYMAAIIVGGAFFGDNLSFISDTTIAATRAAGCEMRDKFRTNIVIILPAVVIVTVLYLIQGHELAAGVQHGAISWVKLVPYLLVIALALTGINVTAVLAIGIVTIAAIGFICGDFSWVGWLESAGRGIAGMSDLIIVTLLAGGLLEMIRTAGGLDWITSGLSRVARGRRGSQFCIAALVSLANVCTANNTIAIITTGGIAKDIADRFGVDPRKTASLLDTFSCLVQGMLPYGAQLLMAASLTGLAPTDIIPFLYYPFIMGACAIVSIIFNYPHGKMLSL